VNLVKLNEVVISAETDCHVWGIMDKIVARTIADAANRNGGIIHAIPSAVVMNVIIFYVMLRRFKPLAIAA
jgi:hypothetical protein